MLRGLSRIYLATVLLLTLFVIYYAGFSIYASAREAAVNQAWEKTLGSSFNPVARYPKTTKNATAQLIEDTTNPDKAQFGLKRPLLQPAWSGGWKVLDSELDKPANQPVSLPTEVRDFLNAHQKQFSAVYAQVRKEAPQWDQDVEKGSAAPVANVSAATAMSRLIALDSLNKKQAGQTAAAQEACEIAMKIDAALHKRGGTVDLVVASSLDDIQSRLMRRLGESPAKWQEQLQAIDVEKNAQWSLAISAQHFSELVANSRDLISPRSGNYFGENSRVGEILTTLARPYLRVCAVDSSEAHRRTAEAIKEGRNSNSCIAWWNVPGKIWVADIQVVEKIFNQPQARSGKG